MQIDPITRAEILSQPDAWTAALEVMAGQTRMIQSIDPAKHYGQIYFTGCGSTYYLSLAAAATTQALTGLTCRAFPASELWLNADSAYPGTGLDISSPYEGTSPYKGTSPYEGETRSNGDRSGRTLLIAVSRSGETTETLRAGEAFLADRRGDLLTFSCYEEMPLAKMGTFNLVLPSGQEQSVAQTRAFSTLYLAATAAACLWAGKDRLFDGLKYLPEVGARLMDLHGSRAAELGQDFSLDRFYWLGSGPRYGLASELSLKMKEMSLTHSEPFHFLEFRHGPKSMITPSSLIVGLRSTSSGTQEEAVLDDVRSIGGRVLDMGEMGTDVRFEARLEEVIQNVLYLPIGQLIALERALAKGLNPDRPTNLDTVVKLS